MVRIILLICFGFLCILIQSNLFLYHAVFPIQPDLTLPLTIYIGLSLNPLQGAILVVAIAYLMDITSGGVLGLYIFLRTFLFLAVYVLKGHLAFENRFLFFFLILVFFLIEALMASVIFHLLGVHLGSTQKVLTTAFFQGIFTTILWIVLYPLLLKLERMSGESRGF